MCSSCIECLCIHRPHVVTVQWLLDSFTKGSLLPETGYIHPDCLPHSPAAVKSHTALSHVPPVASPSTPRQKRADDDLLSQYMDDDPTIGMSGRTIRTCCSSLALIEQYV